MNFYTAIPGYALTFLRDDNVTSILPVYKPAFSPTTSLGVENMSFVSNILMGYIVVVALGLLLLILSYASLLAVRTIVPRNWHLHAATSRCIERVPEMVAGVIRRGVSIFFYGTIVLFALLALFYE
jgi:succinate dehydrogenase/fumarate reductase cytochrome b subunit